MRYISAIGVLFAVVLAFVAVIEFGNLQTSSIGVVTGSPELLFNVIPLFGMILAGVVAIGAMLGVYIMIFRGR